MTHASASDRWSRRTRPAHFVRMRTATMLVCAAVLAGCSGDNGSEGRAYEAEDVVRAFNAAGITLHAERLDKDDPCSSAAYSAIAGVSRSEWDCVYVGPEEGRDMLPHTVLWNVREKTNWIVWIYPNEELAKGVVDNPANWAFRRQPVRYARAGNVVVGYLRAEDEQRLEDALSRI
jgi:hypothetical protein